MSKSSKVRLIKGPLDFVAFNLFIDLQSSRYFDYFFKVLQEKYLSFETHPDIFLVCFLDNSFLTQLTFSKYNVWSIFPNRGHTQFMSYTKHIHTLCFWFYNHYCSYLNSLFSLHIVLKLIHLPYKVFFYLFKCWQIITFL